ncbi:MBL fold metallo-hydrolase, partial [Candidatus Dojkabacteria bacterium]|nr:MBL fold metallo-hydrolase [Candidatus Dojkabacteria bacterium]
AGHHGSKTSSSLAVVQTLSPVTTLISVGAGNPYGHPHAEVLGNLARVSSRVFRTDLGGTLTVTTDGKTIFSIKSAQGVEKFELKH